MEHALHWAAEMAWSFSDHIWTGSATFAGGYAFNASKHIYVIVKARRDARKVKTLTKE